MTCDVPILTDSDGREALNVAAREGFVIDLSMGGWRPRQAATELAQQLGVTLSRNAVAPGTGDFQDAKQRARVIGDGIDSEARGKTEARSAFEDAEALSGNIGTSAPIAIITPFSGLPFRKQDRLLALFLRRLSRANLSYISLPSNHDSTTASVFPGLAPASFSNERQDAIPLRGGCSLIRPENRCDPAFADKSLFDRLSAEVGVDDWVRAYAAVFGHNLYADSELLLKAVDASAAAGAIDLALDFCRRAVECAKRPLARSIAEARAQGIRIASHHFAEAAAAPVANRSAPESLREYTNTMRAWGQVMIGETEAARPVLEAAVGAIHSRANRDIYDHYMLNIAALRRARDGDVAGAEALELEINSDHDKRDARLAYVNLLNLSRLARRRGAIEEARKFQREAFATCCGVMGSWEAFHFEILEALTAELLGEESIDYWIRSALIWISDPSPECLPDRAARALLGARLPHSASEEAMDQTLLAKLGESKHVRTGKPVRFGRPMPEQTCSSVSLRCNAIWGITTGEMKVGATRPSARRLGISLADQLGLHDGGDIVVDAANGYGLGRDGHDAMRLAMHTNANVLEIDGKTGPVDRLKSAESALIRRNPAIRELVGDERSVTVFFQRHRKPEVVSSDAAKVLLQIEHEVPLSSLSSSASQSQAIGLELERRGLMRIRWGCP